MSFGENLLSVEKLKEQVEIVTGQGVGIFGVEGLQFLTPAQREFLDNLAALDLDEYVLDPIA